MVGDPITFAFRDCMSYCGWFDDRDWVLLNLTPKFNFLSHA